MHAKRDPSRLLKLTEGLKERKKATPNPGSSGPVMHMPHRYGLVDLHYTTFAKNCRIQPVYNLSCTV